MANVNDFDALSVDVFQSKENSRLGPKAGLNLQEIMIDKLIVTLQNIPFASQRNAKARKEIQGYFYNRLPKILQKMILVRAAHVFHLKADCMLNICEALGSIWVVKDFLDLTGGYVGSDWCHVPGNWRWGNGAQWSMGIEQCERLFRILSWGDVGSLRSFAICAFSDAANASKLPSIIARAHLLQDVTVLCGATNHLMRIIGINCPLLKKLKIYGSEAVTDVGLRNFFLKRPRGQRNGEKNDVSRSVQEIQVFRTGISAAGCQFACEQMDKGYTIPFLPNNGIFRSPNPDTTLFFDIKYEGSAEELQEKFDLLYPLAKSLTDTIDICVDSEALIYPVLDMYGDGLEGSIYLRERNSMMAIATLHTKANVITELTITWNTIGFWDWDWNSPPSISDIMAAAPGLKRLRSRVSGLWDGSVLFPQLEYAEIWVCSFTTLYSFLLWAPALKTFDCRHIGEELLQDDHLTAFLSFNVGLTQSLQTFNVRPTSLTQLSVLNLITTCPNIKSIGDLQNWKVDSKMILTLNSYLDMINSKCVLKVCNFPPS